MTQNPGPVRYVLYSHYGYSEGPDFAAHAKGKPIEDLPGVHYLLKHCRGLKELLTTPGHEGLLVLFLAKGYEEYLGLLTQQTANRLDVKALLASERRDATLDKLRYVKNIAAYLKKKLGEEGLKDRVRIITCVDLDVILGRVNAILTEEFREYFLGHREGIRYDAPKIVEAILRLRLLGNGVPVLRIDHDVLFRGENADDLGLFKAIACAVRAYQLRLAKTTVASFLFSAAYNTSALERELEASASGQPPSKDTFDAWGRAFATRIHPALVADPEAIKDIQALPESQRDEKWKEYVPDHIDDGLVRKYYGLKPGPKLKADGVNGLAEIGAHPLYAVISGALLCLSEGAILDLPPFSNMAHNVMWIDDHLKYSLHRAMNHFTSGDALDLEPGLSDARLNVSVVKARPPVSNLPAYIFSTYLPTLLWGTIMDAWINKHTILKSRVGELSPALQKEWRAADNDRDTAPLPRAMLEVLNIGRFETASRIRLSAELRRVAEVRINKTRKFWLGLKTESHRSFASFWAAGEVEDHFSEDYFKKPPDPLKPQVLEKESQLWRGLKGPPEITDLGQLQGYFCEAINELITDTVAYVHWTLEWPRLVQIVRSIKQGTFVGDLSWRA